MPGSRPGTERWIVLLRDRGFDLEGQLRTVRAGATEAIRLQHLAALRQLAATDQAALAQLVQSQGGVVEHHAWVMSALTVEIPASTVRVVGAHPRVLRMVPVRSRGSATAIPEVGSTALITEEPAPQQLQPRLQVWGEPLIGRSIELQGEAFPPNSLVVLYSGTWAPFSAAVLSCSQHVVSVGSSFWAVSDAEGHVRWDLQSGSTNPVFALNPALLGQVVGLQAVVPSTLGLSSALRLGIGGGL